MNADRFFPRPSSLTQRTCTRAYLWCQLLLCITLVAGAVSVSMPAQAAIYKCVSASGNTTYTSAPCEQDESTKRISKSATAVPGLDCRIAQKLALDTTHRMKRGENSQAVYDSYGGINSLSPFVIGLISYVYSFDGNDTASASRIATLTTERCQVGSFGPNARHCDVYPFEFIDRIGGCQVALGGAATSLAGNEPGTATSATQLAGSEPASYTLPRLGEAQPVPGTHASPGSAQNEDGDRIADACSSRLTESLTATRSQMRNPQDAGALERLRERERLLKKQLGRC